MSKIELEAILVIAFGNHVELNEGFEWEQCRFCKMFIEEIVSGKDDPHLENCLYVRMQKHVESLGYTQEDYEKLFSENS